MGWISILYFFLWLLSVVLVLLFLMLLLPVNVTIKTVDGKYEVKIRLWFLDINKIRHMFSKRDKKDRKVDKVKKTDKKRSLDYKQVIKYSKLVLASAGKLSRMVVKSMKFKRLSLKLRIGGEDAAKVAIGYGEVCSLFYPLARIFVDINKPKNYNLSVVPDFASESIKADMDICLKTRIFSFLIILINLLRIIRIGLK